MAPVFENFRGVPSADPRPPLAKAVRELRTEREMTQEALAHDAGITVGHLSKIERGLANPGWGTVEAIAKALGVTIADVARRSLEED
jgi:transcriptional regulator with XRE-family HTH domain